jgi:MraZ protein
VIHNTALFSSGWYYYSSRSFKIKDREFLRTILSSVVEMEADKVGRIQIPTPIIKKYNIEKEVVVVGVGDHVEIWSQSKWNEYIEKSDANLEDIAEGIENV